MTARRLEPIQILDWYDGIVLGLVRTSWLPGIFLVSLLAWAQVERKRIFALIPVTEAQSETIKLMEGWDALTKHLRIVAAETSGDVLLIRLDDDRDEVVAETRVSAREVESDVIGDIESAMSPDRGKWLIMF